MYIKLETSSDKVKGLSFHSKRPWILASLQCGMIQIWDYYVGRLIYQFDGAHDGAVCGVHFHKTEPLFVSGGDDYKVKVWNYNLQKFLFSLEGHVDCVNTVEFHHECPWIVSASNDQTVRIWDWQSRASIFVLRGHVHYVTCATIHPKSDLVVSASLDQTVRVWDITSLTRSRKSVSSADDKSHLSQTNPDSSTGVQTYALTGHSAGVKWASLQPTLPLVISTTSDNEVMHWQNEADKRFYLTYATAVKNISCAIYLARDNITVATSADNSIIFWGTNRIGPWEGCWTHSREHVRYGILAAHPEKHLLAAAHDSGMTVFKIQRERPVFAVSGDSLFYVKDSLLHIYEYSTEMDTKVLIVDHPSEAFGPNLRSLSCNHNKNAVLICSDVCGGEYVLAITSKKGVFDRVYTALEVFPDVGESAVFVAQNIFAVLDNSCNQVLLKNLENKIVGKRALPIATDEIFYSGTWNLLLRGEERIVIFDLQKEKIRGSLLSSTRIRHVVWSEHMDTVALLSKRSICIANKNLEPCCYVHEATHVKSGVWGNNGVFIYSTPTHIKYCLPNGASGILKTLDAPVYITKIRGNVLFCLDRNVNHRLILIDSTDSILTLAFLKEKRNQVMSMIRNSGLPGESVIEFLQQNGFPMGALYHVKDEQTQFNRAIESGNIQKALESTKKIDEKEYWNRLGVEALRLGRAGITECACERTKNFASLSFHYLITGNLRKLSEVTKIFEAKNDFMGQFQCALYLGDVRERVNILENAGHLPLAYITASVHGMQDLADRLAAALGENVPPLPEGKKTASLLVPPSPVLLGGDWPLFIPDLPDQNTGDSYIDRVLWDQTVQMKFYRHVALSDWITLSRDKSRPFFFGRPDCSSFKDFLSKHRYKVATLHEQSKKG